MKRLRLVWFLPPVLLAGLLLTLAWGALGARAAAPAIEPVEPGLAPSTPARTTAAVVVDDFQSGVPATWFTYGDGGSGAYYVPSAVLTDTLTTRGAVSDTVLAVAYNIAGWGAGGGRNLAPDDWSAYDGLSLWFYGQNTGRIFRIVLSDNKSGPGDTAERFATEFVDNFSGWQELTFPWEVFYRDAWQPGGEPNDGLTLSEMWAYALIPTSGTGTFYVDQIRTIGAKDVLKVAFESAASSVIEGSSAAITVTLNMTSTLPVTVTYASTDGSATSGDYTAAAGQLVFSSGETAKSFSVATIDDTEDENAETVNLTLSNPLNAQLGTRDTAILTIADNDLPNLCTLNTVPVDDFESGLPHGVDGDGLEIGFVTWGDFWNGTTVAITTTLVQDSDPLAVPGQVGPSHLLRLNANVAGYGGLTHAFENAAADTWISYDWSSYEGVSFWVYGNNTGATLLFEVQDNRNPGSTTSDAEIWSYPFPDDFSGWQYFEVPFSAFARKEIGNGAPNDGFGLTEVHAWAFGMTANPGPHTYYVEDVALIVRTAVVDDFEHGLPTGTDGDGLGIGFVTWGDFWNGTTVAITTTLVQDSDPQAMPCQSGPNHVLDLDAHVVGWGGLTHVFENAAVDTWISQDWSSYEGVSFWVYGRNTGATLFFEVQDNRNPGSTTSDAEIWTYPFPDDFSGWQYFEVPFNTFVRKEIGNGAPNDGFGRTEVHAWAFGMTTNPGPITYYVEDVSIWGRTGVVTPLHAAFDLINYNFVEGDQAEITVTLNMTSTEVVTVSYTTEQADAGNAAIEDRDFTPTAGVLVFAPDETEKTFTVDILQDEKYEGGELLRLRLSDPVNAALGVAYRARLYIESDDPFNPLMLDDFETFPYLYDTLNGVTLQTKEVSAGSPMALPGQGAYEHILAVKAPFVGSLVGTQPMFGTTFAQAQDWSGHENYAFWYYGTNSGETIDIELQENRQADPGPAGWELLWSDEFSGTAGTSPDDSKWTHEIGNGFDQGINGWGNGEFQYYTESITNSVVDGAGNLVITARKIDSAAAGLECWYGACDYTSARLISSEKFEIAYGRVEARMKIPYGNGIWPAFWMLGSNIGEVGWPTSGEIDIMENIGREPNIVHGTIHGPGYSGGASIGGGYTLPSGNYSDAFHTFAVEWEPGEIRWYMDDVLFLTLTDDDIPAGTTWVYDHPFYILMNVAVGGVWPGSPDNTSTFPQTMQVEYVRVYAREDTSERFDATFVDDFTGWKRVAIPFADFERSAIQPAFAPDDGLTLTEVWGHGFILPAGTGKTYYFDQIQVFDFFKFWFPLVRE